MSVLVGVWIWCVSLATLGSSAAPEDAAIEGLFERYVKNRDAKAGEEIAALNERAVPFLAGVIKAQEPHAREIFTVKGKEILQGTWSQEASTLLVRIGGTEAVSVAKDLGTNENAEIRFWGIWILSQVKTEESASFLRERAKHETGRNLGDIVEFLGEWRDPADVPFFRRQLASERDSHVRLALCYAIALSGDLGAVAPIIEACERGSGHLGVVYLQRISGKSFGWDAAKWRQWLAEETAQRGRANAPRTPPQSFQEFCATLDSLGFPDVRNLTWAVYCEETSVRIVDEERPDAEDRVSPLDLYYGWILKDDGKAIELLTAGLIRERRAYTKIGGSFAYDGLLSGIERGECRRTDFLAYARRRREVGPGREGKFSMIERFLGGRLRVGDAGEFAVLAYWSRCLGDAGLAEGLLECAGRPATAQGKRRHGDAWFWESVNKDIAVNLRCHAILAANRVEPRAELLEQWTQVAAFTAEPEAREMISAYERQIAEDEEWKEPSAAEWERASPEERARILIRRLRDHDAYQMSQPGQCCVLHWQNVSRDNPADALVSIGWPAVPIVIEHLDDMAPTRCMGYWRHFAPQSYYVLRVGDACQQVFEAMTGVSIYERTSTHATMVRDGKAKEAKALAQQWWHDNRAKGERAYFEQLLRSGDPSSRVVAAGRLADIDGAAYVQRILGMVERSSDTFEPVQLIEIASPYVGPAHRALLVTLAGKASPGAAVRAAVLLWNRWNDAEGGRLVAARLGELKEEFSMEFALASDVFERLARIEDPAILAAIIGSLQRNKNMLRVMAIHALQSVHDPLAAEALMPILEERGFWEKHAGSSARRWCDEAIAALARISGYPKAFEPGMRLDERDRFIAEWRGWWEKNDKGIDWEALRRAERQKTGGGM